MKQRTRLETGLWLGLVCWLLAFVGTLLLGDESMRGVGITLILLASILFAIKYRHFACSPDLASTEITPQATGPVPKTWKQKAMVPVSLAATAVLALAANVCLLAFPSDTFGAAGLLWLGSIALFIATCWVLSHLGITNHEGEEVERERWPAWEIAIFAGLVLLATVLRVWDLTGFPYNIYGDEVVTGRVAIDAYLGGGGTQPSIFSLLWKDINLPALWFLTIAKSLELGGYTLWSLRLPAALFGAATAIPLYGFVRLGWGRSAAITAAAVYAFSSVAVHYSRITLNNIVTPFFWAVCFYFLLRGLTAARKGYPPRQWLFDFGMVGLAGGLSEHGYYGTRLLPFILVAFLAYLLLIDRPRWRVYTGGFGLIVLGYLVGFGPLFSQYVRNPSLYLGRVNGQLFWDHIPASWDDFQRMVATLWPIMSDNLLSISTISSQDVIYFAPLLLPAEAVLLALGVVLLVWQWKNPASFLMLLVIIGVVLTGGTLVLYGVYPFFAHWIPALPAFYAALAVPVAAWLGEARVKGRLMWLAPSVVAGGLFLLGLINVNFYFRDYYANPDTLRPPSYRDVQIALETRTTQARYQAELGPQYVVYIVGDEYYLYNPDLPYLVGKQEYIPITDPEKMQPVARQPDKGLAFLFMPGGEEYRTLIRRAYPGGKDGEVKSRTDRHLFYTYILEPER